MHLMIRSLPSKSTGLSFRLALTAAKLRSSSGSQEISSFGKYTAFEHGISDNT